MCIKRLKYGLGSLIRWAKSHKRAILAGLFIFVFSLVVTLFMEYIERYASEDIIKDMLAWLIKYPLVLLINCLIVSMLVVFLWFIFKRLVWSILIVSILSVAFSAANYFKLMIRGEPVYPGDLLFPGEVTNIVGATKLTIPSTIVVFGVVLVLFTIASIFIKSLRFRFKKRLIGVAVIAIVWVISFPVYFANSGVQHTFKVIDAIWNQRYNYQVNGFYNAFLMQTKYLIVDKPDGYSKKAAENLLKSSKTSGTIAKTPNIIVIMTESFWDPTRLPNVKFSVDPMKGFNQVKSESLYGNLLVEPFGGNTANTEFEVLTGLSMNALPGGVAYQQYIKREIPSLASLLKAQGYSVEAIHPYLDWFWNRKVVYPLIGMDKFLTLDSFSESDYKGRYVSDKAVGDKIISEFEANQSTGKPFFTHVVTMQNHGSYNAGRYGSDQVVNVSSDEINPKIMSDLNVYSQGVKDAGDNIARLTEYFKNVDEPTVIMMFGDHLPTLGGNYGAYRDSGYVSKGELTNQDQYKLHSTPFLIWSNTSSASKDIGTINANYLTPTMLKNTGVTMSDYFSYLDTKMDGAKSCNKTVCLEANGDYVSRDSGVVKNKLNNQAILQYYYLFD